MRLQDKNRDRIFSSVQRLICFVIICACVSVLSNHAKATVAQGQLASPQNASLIELGRKLFFDARLSQNGTVSCASCHRPDKAFADGRIVAQGVHGRQETRNTPSLRNVAYTQAKFWDGRRPSLETQVLDPFLNPNEHGLRDYAELFSKLGNSADYDDLWQNALGLSLQQVGSADIARALSAYVLSLKQTDTKLDRYLLKGDATAFTLNERRGFDLFRGRAQRATCHHIGEAEVPLTDGEYIALLSDSID